MANITHSAVSSMMCASGRYAKYTSLFVNLPASLSPAMPAHTLAWESTTPLGRPVVPLVYMMTATSDGLGGLGGTGFSRPAAMTSSMLVATTPAGRCASSSAGTSPMVMMCFSPAQPVSAASSSVRISLASQTTTLAAVWLTPWRTPSTPSVAYTVTTVAFWRKAACAAICHSARVSAYTTIFSFALSPVSPTRPLAKAADRSASWSYVSQLYCGASVSFSTVLPAASVTCSTCGRGVSRAASQSAANPGGAGAAATRRAAAAQRCGR